WWCATCYAEITSQQDSISPNYIYVITNWVQGSWNAEYTGYNRIDVATTAYPGQLYVSMFVYESGSLKWGEGPLPFPIPVEITAEVSI
ncbi:MAG: hypothetical protein ACP5I3_11590, partial [Thermoproteus sp.]